MTREADYIRQAAAVTFGAMIRTRFAQLWAEDPELRDRTDPEAQALALERYAVPLLEGVGAGVAVVLEALMPEVPQDTEQAGHDRDVEAALTLARGAASRFPHAAPGAFWRAFRQQTRKT